MSKFSHFFVSILTAALKEKSKKQNMMCTATILVLLKFNNTNALSFVLSEPLSGNQKP